MLIENALPDRELWPRKRFESVAKKGELGRKHSAEPLIDVCCQSDFVIAQISALASASKLSPPSKVRESDHHTPSPRTTHEKGSLRAFALMPANVVQGCAPRASESRRARGVSTIAAGRRGLFLSKSTTVICCLGNLSQRSACLLNVP